MVKFFGLSGSALVATFLAVACSAVPAPQTPGVVDKVSYYRLKTKVIEGDHKKNNLYLQSYHTGAGLSDVSLTSNASEGIKGYLYNSTYQAFNLGTTFPWGLSLAYNQYYTRWLDTQINAGYGDDGFSFNKSGLISNHPEWVGWIVCDWYHVVPQLFWQYYFVDFPLPSSCARVHLLPVPI